MLRDPEVWLKGLVIWAVALLVYLLSVHVARVAWKRWRGDAAVDAIRQDLETEAQAEPSPAVLRPPAPFRQPKDGWAPAPYDEDDIRAIKALAAGKASEGQQQVALTWIVYNACRTYDLPFHPGGIDGQRASDFACGRIFTGQQIIKLINMVMPEKKKGLR